MGNAPITRKWSAVQIAVKWSEAEQQFSQRGICRVDCFVRFIDSQTRRTHLKLERYDLTNVTYTLPIVLGDPLSEMLHIHINRLSVNSKLTERAIRIVFIKGIGKAYLCHRIFIATRKY